MELNIGTNIKRLRLSKGYTQERLAELLNISTAAISKWEAKNTYPDITLLFPLATIFNVTVDELLGYDEAKANAEAEAAAKRYWALHMDGRFDESARFIIESKEKYPFNYSVLKHYMFHIAGGNAGNDPNVLLQNYDELDEIASRILRGCDNEDIRSDALSMKAMLLHARGDTDGALEILNKLPSWAYSQENKREQLFRKDTAEYRYYNRSNLYGLMDVSASKLARTIIFDDKLSRTEKISKTEVMGDELMLLSEKEDMECFAISAQMVFAVLAGMLNDEDNIQDVIRIREKQFYAAKKMMKMAEKDEVLKSKIKATYKTDDIVQWRINILLTSPHTQFVKLREYPEYVEMLNKWKK